MRDILAVFGGATCCRWRVAVPTHARGPPLIPGGLPRPARTRTSPGPITPRHARTRAIRGHGVQVLDANGVGGDPLPPPAIFQSASRSVPRGPQESGGYLMGALITTTRLVCQHCGGSFKAPRAGVRYCSDSCRRGAWKSRREAPRCAIRVLVCTFCSSPFVQRHRSGRSSAMPSCSNPRCREQYHRARNREYERGYRSQQGESRARVWERRKRSDKR